MKTIRVSVVALVSLFLLPAVASAAVATWTGAESDDWTDPANWTEGVPGATDTARFAEENPGTLSIIVPTGISPDTIDAPAQTLFF